MMFSPFLVLATGFAFQQSPSPTLTPEMRCDILMARKDYRNAIDCFKAGADKSPVMANKTGIAYHQLGDPADMDSARKYYQKAIKMDPKYAEAINNLGTVYFARKSYRRAISEYNKALRLRPDAATFMANLAFAYLGRKEYELASQEFLKAVQLDPDILERRGTTGSSVQDQTVEDRAKYHFYQAKTYAQAGAKDRAIQCIRKALEEGFKDRNKFLKEPAFASLQDDPEFKQLMASEQKVL